MLTPTNEPTTTPTIQENDTQAYVNAVLNADFDYLDKVFKEEETYIVKQ